MTAGRTKHPTRITHCVSDLPPEICSEMDSPSGSQSKKPLRESKCRVNGEMSPQNEPTEHCFLTRREAPQHETNKAIRRRSLHRFVSQELVCEIDETDQKKSLCFRSRAKKLNEQASGDLTSARYDEMTDSHVSDEELPQRLSGSPMRCVSDFDDVDKISSNSTMDTQDGGRVSLTCKATEACHLAPCDCKTSLAEEAPHVPISLQGSSLLAMHTYALRLEAELFPMRLILSRLMSHVTHNRRGLFNAPVDPVALRLPDYSSIVTKPMDLGTVKAKLHAVSYTCREDVADDIRLVFNNAIRYNPPNNPVHGAARVLLSEFESAYQGIQTPPRCPSQSHRCPPSSSKESTGNSCLPSIGLTPSSKSEQPFQGSQGDEPIVNLSPVEIKAGSFGSNSTDFLPSENPLNIAGLLPAKSNSEPEDADTSATRDRVQGFHEAPEKVLKRRKAKRKRVFQPHKCQSCHGRTCILCAQGCLHHEPTLLICAGANCGNAKIRKGAFYYIARDGTCQFCQRCYSNLSAVLPKSYHMNSPVRYKRDLLKRKNDEEVVEDWVTCIKCGAGLHQVCAMHNQYIHGDKTFVCPHCVSDGRANIQKVVSQDRSSSQSDAYTFRSGWETPVKLSDVYPSAFSDGEDVLRADSIPETPESSFIQLKVQEQMKNEDIQNAQFTVSVRLISDCNKYFRVPDVIRRHFRMEGSNTNKSSEEHGNISENTVPPSTVKYNSKAFALFQRIDGLDVCVFCMYCQEYDENGQDGENEKSNANQKRVYIAYLDSIEHFRPRESRTQVYHEMLVAYLATARARGYETAHIWACPPARGNSFVFWSHPASQRTPTKERLVSWYHGALSRAVDCGVVVDVRSLYQRSFEKHRASRYCSTKISSSDLLLRGKMVCPPLFDGDFWIEEAVRIHAVSMARHLKSIAPPKAPLPVPSVPTGGPLEFENCCPARLVASLLHDRIMAHPSSAPFRRPVNAAALNLKDYHRMISKPMDLGTVYARCLLGEFPTLKDLVSDVELVFTNATLYNPKGHLVHNMAIEMRCLFYNELNMLVSRWPTAKAFADDASPSPWLAFADLSMSLDMRLDRMELSREVASFDGDDVALVSKQVDCNEHPLSSSLLPSKELTKNSSIHPSASMDKLSLQNSHENLAGEPDAILQRMVGDDVWLIDKKCQSNAKGRKRGACKRKNAPSCGNEETLKRRRQSWLGDEVGESVRAQRTSFFTCDLKLSRDMTAQDEERAKVYDLYIAPFVQSMNLHKSGSRNNIVATGRIADTRHAFLEFCQYRNLEFDTMRKAKYSTAMLLYHLHSDAPGLVPVCTSCGEKVGDVRWHKVKSTTERLGGRWPAQKKKSGSDLGNAPSPSSGQEWKKEELCSSCHSKAPNNDEFIPLQVSFS